MAENNEIKVKSLQKALEILNLFYREARAWCNRSKRVFRIVQEYGT